MVVTVPILIRLAGSLRWRCKPHPFPCRGGREGVFPAANDIVSTDLGKARSDAIRQRFIGTLTARAQVWHRSAIAATGSNGGGGSLPTVLKSARRKRESPMRIALYEPDIPQNTGTILRLCACLGIGAHIIEPAGFPSSDRAFRRAGMDYLDVVAVMRHRSWRDFDEWRRGECHRLLLFTTAADRSYLDYGYRDNDILLFGRESAGLPQEVHAAADARLVIPMRPGLRSLNVAVAAAMAAGEALRQTGGMPGPPR
jgi:tRNA (cytidine/uridine-2'-O-)-methyltransferase